MSARSPADTALERLRAVCFGLPAVEERLSHGTPSFFVRGKMFASFADDHHGAGFTAAWCKADVERQQALVAEAPERYFVPPYVGKSGWVGVHLDAATDWEALTFIIEEAWSAVAPKSARFEPVMPPPPAAPLAKTDPAVAKAALERLLALTAELPGCEVEREKWHATFRVKKKPFLYFLDNHHGDGKVAACVKVAAGQNSRLVEGRPDVYFMPAYIGPRGWVGILLDRKRVDWKDVAARVQASHAATAPKPRSAGRAR